MFFCVWFSLLSVELRAVPTECWAAASDSFFKRSSLVALGSIMACTKATDSLDSERIVSVRPYLKKLEKAENQKQQEKEEEEGGGGGGGVGRGGGGGEGGGGGG